MISVPLYGIDGQTLEPVTVEESRLGGTVRLKTLREAIRAYERNRRVCTKGHLSRAEVRGSTRKIYRQKHTGFARAGQRTVSHRRGGGLAFPPRTRNMVVRMPRKMRRTATRSALLSRLLDGEVCLVKSIDLDAPRTKTLADFLKRAGLSGRRLLVCSGDHRLVWKSGRNIKGLTVQRAADVNAYELMAPDGVIFTQASFEAVLEALAV